MGLSVYLESRHATFYPGTKKQPSAVPRVSLELLVVELELSLERAEESGQLPVADLSAGEVDPDDGTEERQEGAVLLGHRVFVLRQLHDDVLLPHRS